MEPFAINMNKNIFEVKNRPWLLVLELSQIITSLLVKPYLYVCEVKIGKKPKFYGFPRILRYAGSRILIGDMFENRNTLTSNPLSVEHPLVLATTTKEAKIIIGNHVGISGGNIVSASKIEIGNYTMIGSNCVIIDTDFHPLTSKGRRYIQNKGKTSPIKIGEHVFVGTRSTILRGVSIGNNSVIGAGSVVRINVPANSIFVDGKIKKLHE